MRCLAPEADTKNGCPDCDYTIKKNLFKKNYYKALRGELESLGTKTKGLTDEDLDEGFSFKMLQSDYNTLCELEALAGSETEFTSGALDKNWGVRVYYGISIIREERYKVRRFLDAQAKAKRKANNKRG